MIRQTIYYFFVFLFALGSFCHQSFFEHPTVTIAHANHFDTVFDQSSDSFACCHSENQDRFVFISSASEGKNIFQKIVAFHNRLEADFFTDHSFFRQSSFPRHFLSPTLIGTVVKRE